MAAGPRRVRRPRRGAPPQRDSPAFATFFEFRPTGPTPFTRGAEATSAGWVRLLDPGPARDSGHVAALADAWWPAVLTRLPAPRPIATVTFVLELVGDCEGLDPAAPLLHFGRAVAARDGYVIELRELWGETAG